MGSGNNDHQSSFVSASRRTVLETLGATTIGLSIGGAERAAGAGDEPEEQVSDPHDRKYDAIQLRASINWKTLNGTSPIPDPKSTWEREGYSDHAASYTKGLPHDDLGLVDPEAYDALKTAMVSGDPKDFTRIPLGEGTRQLKNPQAAFSFELVGPDSHANVAPEPPSLESAEVAAEMVDCYWRSECRDIPFREFSESDRVAAAVAELSNLSEYPGQTRGDEVTTETVFRLFDLPGATISQFMLQPYARGALQVEQRIRTGSADSDYLTDYDEWLASRRGAPPSQSHSFDETERFVHDGRSLAEFVHEDVPNQSFDSAVLMLLGREAPVNPTLPFEGAPLDPNIPFEPGGPEIPFVNYGFFDAIDAVTSMLDVALNAAWYNKWGVYNRLRPETFGGLVHNRVTGRKEFPIHDDLLEATVLERVHDTHGTHLLPVAYPEGAPLHPAYPSGHATVAGACATALKAYFDESYVFPDPVVPTTDGTDLVSIDADLTLREETDKLAANIANGRIWAGLHYWSDAVEGLCLGEEIAISVLRSRKELSNHADFFEGWQLTRFDGKTITV